VPPLRGGAVEKIWFALGQEFARRGHEVTHISRAFADLPHEEIIEGVRHIRVSGHDTPRSMVRLKLLDLLYSLRVLPKLPAADILITNTFWLPILVRSNRFGKIYVHVARYPKGQMRFYAHAARLQTVSGPIKEAILAELPGRGDLVECIPNPLPEWNAHHSPPALGGRLKHLLYVGRVHPEKGLDLLISAIARIPKELFAGWKLLVVGPAEASAGGGGADYLATLRRMTESIPDRVEWVGPVYDATRLADYYRNSSLFLYPSLAERGESFGLAPLEAMSHGCPALVSDLSCFRDFIAADVNGFVFDHRASEPAAVLADAITDLIRNEAQIESVREAALSKAREFSVERVAGLYLRDFQTLSTS
jgi:glycosyltransferase involved in cell wall biosynthesis